MNYIDPLLDSYAAEAHRKSAQMMRAYLKDQFEFFGIQSPGRHALNRDFYQEHGHPKLSEIPNIVRYLWAKPQRECQYLALEILEKVKRRAPAEWMDLYLELITTKSWWDTVDKLATHMVAAYFQRHPSRRALYIEPWLDSENIWLQRTTILFQLKYKTDTDEEILFDSIRHCAGSKEFFLQKAIGWALREYSRTEPEMIRQFIETEQLKPLSIREGMRLMKPQKIKKTLTNELI